ncbi:helix-turn-helix transcriptional regulator [Tenggerimyces flavus]|uniref:LuxR C-terminal-related transcriptional regulator n=1 Tax=Tenggerimyces flavus TaxID=1708749 RepID=A0ABV7YCX0_9ACTN|nr:helix-turn-helix transcriptional regulator [Tenggerimyces flavus]MBM7787150.1 DNA-binding CsgD family transcriptional regulator [Tenggerimyces flavus]
MTSAVLARAEREVVRLCHSGLDPEALRERLLRTLRRAMSIDAAFFATADPETLLFTSAYADEPLGSATDRFLANEYGGTDHNRFAALATARSHVASLDASTRRDRFASKRYSEIMRPLGLGDELRAAFVAGADCWGYLCLHREDASAGFSRTEAALIARIGPHVAHGLRQGALLGSVSTTAPPPGVLLLDDRLEVVATTPEASDLLSLLPCAAGLPVAVYAAAAALRGGQLPTARVRAADGGWLHVYASRLTADRIAVVVERATPHATAALLLSAYGLSRRERDVATAVIRGESTKEISAALHLSEYTVQDHLKAVFDKVGVRSRRELVGLLLGA